ncbi:MAG: sulfotransferase [Actinomycetota bacterium]
MTKVLYIVGWGRSGSTILGNVLGELDGFFHTGELWGLWGSFEKGPEGFHARRCGCGERVEDCEIWGPALRTCASGLYPAEVKRWYKKVVRLRYTVRLIRGRPATGTSREALAAYLELLNCLYATIADATDSRVIVDSSSRPPDAAVLRMLSGVRPYFLHMVRDPRAVAYSWTRQTLRPDTRRELPRHGSTNSTINWLTWNLAAEMLGRRNGSEGYLRIRYEDFVRDPRETVLAIADFVGEPRNELPFIDGRTARLGTNHTVWGNPVRFSSGDVEIRDDREWREALGAVPRVIATVMALPRLRRYGYPIRSGAERESSG